MKFKFIGEQDEITLRGVTFEKGKAVVVDDASLAEKISVLPYFEEVKRGPKPKAKKDGNAE